MDSIANVTHSLLSPLASLEEKLMDSSMRKNLASVGKPGPVEGLATSAAFTLMEQHELGERMRYVHRLYDNANSCFL